MVHDLSTKIAVILGEELAITRLKRRSERGLNVASNRIANLFKGESGFDEGTFYGQISDALAETLDSLAGQPVDDLDEFEPLSKDPNHFQFDDIGLGDLDIALGVAYYASDARAVVFRTTAALHYGGTFDSEPFEMYGAANEGHLGRRILGIARRLPENNTASKVYDAVINKMDRTIDFDKKSEIGATAAEAVLNSETPERKVSEL